MMFRVLRGGEEEASKGPLPSENTRKYGLPTDFYKTVVSTDQTIERFEIERCFHVYKKP